MNNDLKQYEIQFSTIDKPEFPKSKTNRSATVFCEHFMQAVNSIYEQHPNAQIWSVTHRQRWTDTHKLIVTPEALHRFQGDK